MGEPSAQSNLPRQSYDNDLYYGTFYEEEDVVYAMQEFAKEYARYHLEQFKNHLKDKTEDVINDYYID